MDPKLYCRRTFVKVLPSERADFGELDSKGREYGALIDRKEVMMVPVEPDAHTGWKMPAGLYHVACVQAARSGRAFGASQPEEFFKTEAEREAYIDRRINAMQKRYCPVRDI